MDKRIQFVRLSVHFNLIHRFNAIPVKIPTNYFVSIDKSILRFTYRDKRYRIVNIILKGKNKVVGLTLLYFKTYNTATGTKMVQY